MHNVSSFSDIERNKNITYYLKFVPNQSFVSFCSPPGLGPRTNTRGALSEAGNCKVGNSLLAS